MGRAERHGKMKSRDEMRKTRHPLLGYFLIVTDTENTEKNYLEGLRKSLPENIRRKIAIRVVQSATKNLVETCLDEASMHPNYSEYWIVFDRDRVISFDQIILNAYKKEIHVGWSNPCIEIWFMAYFGKMPSWNTSMQCCDKFAEQFKRITSKSYKKSDTKIYEILSQYGDEEKACNIAENKRKICKQNKIINPSDMCPCTRLDLLVRKIKSTSMHQ